MSDDKSNLLTKICDCVAEIEARKEGRREELYYNFSELLKILPQLLNSAVDVVNVKIDIEPLNCHELKEIASPFIDEFAENGYEAKILMGITCADLLRRDYSSSKYEVRITKISDLEK